MFLIYLYIRFKLFLTGKNGFEQFSVVLCRKLKTLRERSVLWYNMHPAYGTTKQKCCTNQSHRDCCKNLKLRTMNVTFLKN